MNNDTARAADTAALLERLAAERAARPVTAAMMVKAERFRDAVMAKHSPEFRAEYEVKQFEVSACATGGCVVYVVTGRVGDEGTMAEIFCRDTRHVMIGRNGGFKLLNAKGKGKRHILRTSPTGRHNALWHAVA